MPLYPTLEDLLVGQYQYEQYNSCSDPQFRSSAEPSAPVYESNSPMPGRIYESLDESTVVAVPEKLRYPSLPSCYESIVQPQHTSDQQYVPKRLTSVEKEYIVAPITSQYSGLAKANLTHGVRKVILNRAKGKKYGLRMRAVNQGVFVQLVAGNSPAAAAGIRFGDQLLNLNGTEVLGMSGQKVMNMLKKSKHQVILVLRDRPMARTITLHKDAAGLLGFSFKDNLITAVMQNSSASRNGLLTNQRIIEVDGRNVMAFKNKAMKLCLEDAPMTVTLTLMPAQFFDEIIKKSYIDPYRFDQEKFIVPSNHYLLIGFEYGNLDSSLMKKQNRTVPEV